MSGTESAMDGVVACDEDDFDDGRVLDCDEENRYDSRALVSSVTDLGVC